MSKNNVKEYVQKMQPQHQRYTLKKLTVGVASVLIGTTTYLASSDAVHADTVNSNAGSADVSQETKATIDTHEVDVSSSSASSSISSDNVSSAVSAASASQNEQTSSADSAISASSEAVSPSVSSASSTNSTLSAVMTINTTDINTAGLQTASAASLNDSKIAVTQTSTTNGVTIPANQDGNANEKLVGTGQSKTVTLDDGSTLTTQYDQLDSKNQTTILTFKSSSFKAGDTYTIKIPKKGGLNLLESNIAKLQPAFGTTVFDSSDSDWYVVTDKFINSGTVSQSIKLSQYFDLNTYPNLGKLGAFTEIINDIALLHGDETKTLTVTNVSPRLSMYGYGSRLMDNNFKKIGLADQSNPVVINNSDAESTYHLRIYNANSAGGNWDVGSLKTLKIHLDTNGLYTGLIIDSAELLDSDGSTVLVEHNFDSDGNVAFTSDDFNRISPFKISSQMGVLNLRFRMHIAISDDKFVHHKYSIPINTSAITISAEDQNHVLYTDHPQVGSAIVVNDLSNLTAGELLTYSQGYMAGYSDNDYSTPLRYNSVLVNNGKKNGNSMSSLINFAGSVFNYGGLVSTNTNQNLSNFEYTLNIPDGLNFVNRGDMMAWINGGDYKFHSGDYITVKYRDGSVSVTNVNDIPRSDKEISSISVHLADFKTSNIKVWERGSRFDDLSFAKTYADGTPVQAGDLFTITATLSADGVASQTVDLTYIRAADHDKNLPKGVDDSIAVIQSDKTPGVKNAGSIVYYSGADLNTMACPQYGHPVIYLSVPKNASLSDFSGIQVQTPATRSDGSGYSQDLTPKSMSTIKIDNVTFIKVDLSNYNKLNNGVMITVPYGTLPDLQSSSEKTAILVTADNLNDSELKNVHHYAADASSDLKTVFGKLVDDEKINVSYTTYYESSNNYEMWDVLTSDGLGSATMASGNKTYIPSLDSKQDDHGTNVDQFDIYGTMIDATDASIRNATQIINIPNVSDGTSQFNVHLTGPISLVNANTEVDLSKLATVYYSTSRGDLSNVTINNGQFTGGLLASQVTDWSKIQSVMIRFNSALPARTSARAVLHVTDPQIYDHVGKTIYVENVVYAYRYSEHDANVFVTSPTNNSSSSGESIDGFSLKPVYIKPGSPASAKLTVEGQSTITTWVHYKDATGKDQYVQLPDKTKTYNELSDVMNRSDFMSSGSDLTIYDRSLLPSNLVIDWNSQPTIQNSSNTYLDGYQNGTAEFGKTVKYDFDGDRVVYEAAFAKQVTRDKTVKRTIHYKYADGSTAKPDVEQTSKRFNNIGFEDPFTHQVTWADTTDTDTLANVNSSAIVGYTSDQSDVNVLTVNFNSNDSEVTVTYTPDIQRVIINYIDDTTGQTLKTDCVQGNSDSVINYQTKTQIDQYLNQHYILVSNDFNDGHENYDHDSTATQTFNVRLKHDTQVASDARTKKLLVHYVYASGQPRTGKVHDDQSAPDIIFSRTGINDLVTNQTTWNNWNISSATFDAVSSPVIAGYTPDLESIKDITVDPDSFVLTEKTVTYKADTQKITINYIDDTTGQTLNSDQLTGLSGASANYTTKNSIDGYINQGYDLVSDSTNGQNLVFDTDANSDQVYNVYLKHHLENVSRTSDVNETINYVYIKDKSQAAPQYKATTISFTQTGVKDHVTNTIVWNNVDSQEFNGVQSPMIDGYTADQLSIPAITVHFGGQDITRTVSYSPNTQNLDVVFIDDTTGEVLKTIKKSGLSDTSADYNTKSDIGSYKAQHYNLVSDSTDGQSLVFDHNDNTDQHYEVHLSHAIHQINEEHDIDQVIHYVYANGSKAADDYANSVHFVRDGYHDEVTNTDHWTAWNPGATYNFVAVQSPKIQGFTPDVQTVDQVTVNPASQNIKQTVTYYGNVQLAHVKYIDDTDNGRVMSSDDLSGHTGETDSYTTAKNIKNYINQGYVFISDNYPVAGVVFDNNDLVDQYFEVHFKHGTTTVTPDQPGEPGKPINPGYPNGSTYPTETDAKSLQADVSRRIDYVYQSGKQAQPSVNDSLHFTETKVIDKVTGEVLSDTWSPVQDFDTKITPTIDGYTPDRQSVSNTGINYDYPAIHEVVTYNPDAQKAVVKYIDDTDQKQLSVEDLTGYSDEDSGYNTKSSIDKYLAEHYVLVSDDTNGQNVVYDHDGNKDQVYEVHFKHGTESANESRTKNLIVRYVYADGLVRNGKAADDQNAQSLTFNRTGIRDLVTNNIAWNAWDHTDQTFGELQSPEIQGYTPDQASIKDVKVVADSPELTEKTVVYNADSQKIAINYIDDTIGKTLQTINLIGKSDSNSGYITKQSIARYLKQHYGLVSDDTNGEELVYDHDSSINQVYNVHLNHRTHTINDQTTKSEVIHYVYADGLSRTGKAADDYHANKLTFTRDGYRDEVTNEDHWNSWTPAQQEFASVKSPDIQGYTADQAEIPVIKMISNSDNVERTVTYNADNQKLDVVFIDDTAGKTLSIVTREGLSDESANYNTEDDLYHYKSLHYNVVSDGTNGANLVFDHDDSKAQHYEVHLVHATHPINGQTSTKQTIHYQLANGTKVFDDYTAKVDFSRDGYNDEVTNENHWNAWTPNAIQTFGEVVSPIKQGYTPDKAKVAAVNVHPGDKDLEETVVYSPDEQKITVNYIDDITGRTFSTKQLTGVSDASANYNTKSSIDGYVANHYKLVSDDTNGDNLVFDHDDNNNQVYNVHLTHTYQIVDDHASVNETVHYIYDNGQTVHPDYKASAINFSRTGTQDLVTKDIVWNAWTSAERSFDQVTTPAINGYTPDIEVVPSVPVNHSSKDVERTVTYHADDQTILINYIDEDTHSTLKTDTVIGKTAQTSDYVTRKSIDNYMGQHYILVSDDTNGENLVFDSDSTKAQVYSVHLKHSYQSVDDASTVNETVHYVYADGSQAANDYYAPAISFRRTGDKDLVMGTITWNAWMPESQDFVEVNSPVIDGYTPSQNTISGITVKPGDKDIDQIVVYAPDTQSIVVNYVDDITGKTLKTDALTGKSDQISDYTTKNSIDGYENQHYVLVSDNTDGKALTFDHDDAVTQVYNVHLSHQTEPVSQSRTVNETINYVYADGLKAADTFTAKPLTFTQTGVEDLVTGSIDWTGSWTDGQTFGDVKSPEVIGYTASQNVVSGVTVDHNSADIHQTVIYTANDQTAKIKYIDDATGKTLEIDSANGKFGEQIKFDHNINDQIKNFENQGYKFKSSNFDDQKYQADNSQNKFEVHFTHGTQNVSRTNEVNETVKYQFEDGRQEQKDHVQAVDFIQHGVQDLVTKTVVWTPSDPQNFESVATPEITGYTADLQDIPALAVNFGDNDITKVVTYKVNDQIADIKYVDDTTDKVLKADIANGKFGQEISFNEVPANVISDFTRQGYKLVSNNFNGQSYQADDSKNQFEVHLVHGTQDVSRTSTVTRTIKYVDQNTGKEIRQPVNQTVTFTETGVTDLVTGETVWTMPSDQHLSKVESPAIDGYENPEVPVVGEATVKFGEGDQTVTVYYHKVKAPSTSDTLKTPDVSSTLSMSNVCNSFEIPTNLANTSTQGNQNAQTVSQNIGDQHTADNVNTNQLPQTGNQNDRQLGLIGLVGATFAGLIGFGKKKRRE